jgi:hypothetical protein
MGNTRRREGPGCGEGRILVKFEVYKLFDTSILLCLVLPNIYSRMLAIGGAMDEAFSTPFDWTRQTI